MGSGFVDVAGGRLAFEMTGDGPVVTFIHPGLWDMRVWDREFETWADRFRLIRYDLRGYGRSTRPTGAPYGHVEDLRDLLDHLDVRATALVGASMGGAIAIDFALEHPERVTALVLAAPDVGGLEPLEEEEDWWDAHTAGIDEAVEAGDLERAQDLRLAIWAPLGTDDEAGARIRRIAMDNVHELTMDESAQVELEPPAALRLGEIDVPVLVLIAEHDPPHLRRAGELIAREVLSGRSVPVGDADHVVNLRRPDVFDAEALPFLARLD